ncbi:MAG: hypothetical protein JF887_10945 [Candidatus Dormibacteraeota bacterium]|uniref:DUF1232 domain-containing protein n=1 Tax=Candidatus Amunia macphersoniae TaxID=3127014 RepID=A0A934KLK9_9BACT|nr:hypothetical protein [Candidatus Dormibacteraeota bacterium]
MLSRFRLLKRLAFDLPKQARLAYCLMRDPRVPRRTKLAFGAAIGVIVTPFINLPDAIPVVGEIDMLALSMLALRLYIAACPDDAVADVQQQILEGRSVFDVDLRNGERIATVIATRFRHDDASSGRQTGAGR